MAKVAGSSEAPNAAARKANSPVWPFERSERRRSRSPANRSCNRAKTRFPKTVSRSRRQPTRQDRRQARQDHQEQDIVTTTRNGDRDLGGGDNPEQHDGRAGDAQAKRFPSANWANRPFSFNRSTIASASSRTTSSRPTTSALVGSAARVRIALSKGRRTRSAASGTAACRIPRSAVRSSRSNNETTATRTTSSRPPRRAAIGYGSSAIPFSQAVSSPGHPDSYQSLNEPDDSKRETREYRVEDQELRPAQVERVEIHTRPAFPRGAA